MQTENVKPIIRIGIVGTGARGMHCFGRLLKDREGVQIAALADQNEQRLHIAKTQLDGKPETYTDAQVMFEEAALDGVIITTPDFTHTATACAALRAGITHVLVEKPLGTTVQDCLQITKAMDETGGRVAVAFNLRFVPVLRRIKDLISNGEIGRLIMGESREFVQGGRTYMSRWNRKYELSGGLWTHKGSHDFDISNWWNGGGKPQRVYASASSTIFQPDNIPFLVEEGTPVGPTCSQCAYYDICPDHHDQGKTDLFNTTTATSDGYHRDLCVYTSDKSVHDNGIALVDYDNDVRISHTECFACNFSDRIYTMTGDRGIIEARLSQPTQITFKPRWGGDRIIEVTNPREGGHGGADPALADDVIAFMRGETTQLSSVDDGISAVAVAQAAEISWREKRLVEIGELIDLNAASFSATEVIKHSYTVK